MLFYIIVLSLIFKLIPFENLDELDIYPIFIAPIVEELFKFFGYYLIILFGNHMYKYLNYNSKKEFVDDNILWAFVIIVSLFGGMEGFSHNIRFGLYYLPAFVILNILAHFTYSVYPYVFGREHNNKFFYFLPIAIILHTIHNFIISYIWDNKFVTLTIVTAFLIPILIWKRDALIKHIIKYISFKNPHRAKIFLTTVFIIIYFYIILSCIFAF